MLVTIDLWGTLIKANPLFSQAKIDLVDKYFPNIHRSFIHLAFIQTKNKLNEIIERTGWQPTMGDIYSLLFSYLGLPLNSYDDNVILAFYNEYQRLALKYKPELYGPETLKYLAKLTKRNQLCISSNTMLLGGDTMEEICELVGIHKYISDYNFSDHLGKAKPNICMYSTYADILLSTYHIGDNERTDFIGPNNVGITGILINGNTGKTLKDAYKQITSANK